MAERQGLGAVPGHQPVSVRACMELFATSKWALNPVAIQILTHLQRKTTEES
jgi:hypothetical protein